MKRQRHLRDHGEKHFASPNSLAVQSVIESKNFYQYTQDDPFNTVLVPKSNPSTTILEYLLASEPMLCFDFDNQSIFIQTTNPASVEPDTYEYLLGIVGTPGAKLSDGTLWVIRPEDATNAVFFGKWSLTCWNDGQLRSNPGSIYVKISPQPDFNKYTPTTEQAELAAILCLKNTFETIDFTQDDLYMASTRIINIELNSEQKKEYESRYGPIKEVFNKKLTSSLRYTLELPQILSQISNSGENLKRASSAEIGSQKPLVQWYNEFMTVKPGVEPLSYAILRWSNFKIDPDMLTWQRREELQNLWDKRKDLAEIMKAWAWLMFQPQTLKHRSQQNTLGSPVAQMLTIALMDNSETSKSRMKWVADNVYLFSVLYQLTKKYNVIPNDIVPNDYLTILCAFSQRFPCGQWTYHNESKEIEMNDQMRRLLLYAKQCSKKLKPGQEKKACPVLYEYITAYTKIWSEHLTSQKDADDFLHFGK